MTVINQDVHKYNSGLIGNCGYLAQVTSAGSINWLCWPKFDSPSIFGALLDVEGGGSFDVCPAQEQFDSRQYYLNNTNILCTEFLTSKGAFRVTDFAPRYMESGNYARPLILCRKIEPLSGTPEILVRCRPRGNWGKTEMTPQIATQHIHYSGMNQALRLYASVPFKSICDETPVRLDKTMYLALSWSLPVHESVEHTVESCLRKTQTYWEHWVFRTTIGHFYQKQVIRSALILKIHQFEDTGAIIASSTTSLPEAPGSIRTWDYRYCWLRDAYYTLKALHNIGHYDELIGYANYVQNIAISETTGLQPVYAISGDYELTERHLDLPGYLGHQPVREGNLAYTHVQNDVYGQVLYSLLPIYVDERFHRVDLHSPSLELIHQLLSQIEKRMDEPDAGLWEFRNKVQHHCYTYLFHWAGGHSALKIASKYNSENLGQRSRVVIDKARQGIERCYHDEKRAYCQAEESKYMDASLFQLITMGYLDPRSERAADHIRALEAELRVDQSPLFFRYRHADDFGKPRTAFLICGFWYVEALATMGRVTEAIEMFESLLTYSNELGLLSEDVDPATGDQWGNFPQTYSHVGLMNAAFKITQKLDRPDFA